MDLKVKIPNYELTDEQFFELCASNREVRFERDKNGNLIIMAPTGGFTGRKNFNLSGKLYEWWLENGKQGILFDSSTGFRLPDNSVRSPDLSWISKPQWDALTEDDKRRFPPLCPEFIIELKSETDYLENLQNKMQTYLSNGMRLGWLVNPDTSLTYVYQPNQEPKRVKFTEALTGENVLPNLSLILLDII